MTTRYARFVAAAMLAAACLLAPAAAGAAPLPSTVESAQAASLSRWAGHVDVYRSGVFSTQKTFLWCTAADVQIARNIVRGASDHSRASQSSYFSWMRAHNRYNIPVSDGVDPQGWAAGMRNFVDPRYRLATFRTYTTALRSAVTSLRLTNRPVGVLVARGGHAWLMTGFSATADPAATSDFTVTSVRVVGPLYGLQSRNGYDMPPNTSLSASAFRHFFTPWHYAGIRMVWEGLYGTVQAAPANPAPAPRAAAALHPPIPAVSRPMPPVGSSVTGAGPQAPAASAAPASAPLAVSKSAADRSTGRLDANVAAVLGLAALVAVVTGVVVARSRRGAIGRPARTVRTAASRPGSDTA